MNDDDELNDAEREFLMAQPDSIQDVDIRSTFDTFVDRYPDTPGISHEHLMGSTEDVSRELNFQVSQSYAAFDDEDALRKYGDMMQSNNNSEPVRGLLGLPPLECDSVMLKGDSGVCLWSTLDRPVDVDVTDIETDDVRRQAQRIRSIQANGGSAQSASTINTSIESLLSEYHRQKGDIDARREAGEAERKRRRVELAIRAEEATSAAAAREGGAFQFEPEKEKLWVAKYGPKTFKDLLSDESANLRILQWVKSWNSYVFADASESAARQTIGETDHHSPAESSFSTLVTQKKNPPASALSSGEIGVNSGASRPMDRILLIVGPPGVGKTTLAHVIAAHCGYEAREINASSDRSVGVLETMISDAVSNTGRHAQRKLSPSVPATRTTPSTNKPLLTLLRPKCLIIDEMDGIQAGVVKMLLEKDIHRPVLCLANNLYAPALRGLRSSTATIIQIPPIVGQRLVHRLEYITSREKLDVDRGTLSELVQVSNGDVRCCLNTLQFLRRTPGERVSAHELQRALAQLRGKDTTLGLWPLWTDTFTKKDKQKYVSMLNSEFRMQWDDVVSAQASTTGARPSRVDPGFVYMNKRLGSCGDLDSLVDGLFQHYSQQRYSDYSLEKTRRCVDSFALQDLITAHGYQHNAIGLSDKFAVVTGASCFAACSSLGRGTPLTFPREGQNFREQLMRGEEAAHGFTQHAAPPIAVHYNATTTVALDVAPLVPRCLINSLIKFPGHSFTSIRGLNQVDQKLFLEAVDRHVEYGLSYVADDRPDPRRAWQRDQALPGAEVKPHGWTIQPPLHVLGCSAHSDGGRGVAGGGGGVGANGASSKWPSKNFATPSTVKSEDDLKQKGPLIFRLRDEVKQMLVGEISQAKIRKHAAHFVVPPAPATSGNAQFPMPAPVQLASAAPPPTDTAASIPLLPQAPAPVASTKRTPIKRDFFGRPMATKSAAPEPPQLFSPEKSSTAAKPSAGSSTKLPPTHEVKYVYFDGSTNAVKLPAQLSDF